MFKNKIKIYSVLILCITVMLSVFCGCQNKKTDTSKNQDFQSLISSVKDGDKDLENAEKREKYINKILNKMSLEEKIYQMMFVTPEQLTGMGQVTAAGETTKKALKSFPVGGIIYFSQNIEDAAQIKEMIKNSQKFSEIPLFIGVDEEGGRVSRLGSNKKTGVKKIGDMKSVGETKNPQNAYEVGKTLGEGLSRLGFNVDFAPVADILVNENNTEIGDRSFGKNPQAAASMVENEVKGLKEENVCSVLKHFPGHGSTQSNSHTGFSESTRTLAELKSGDFIPFESGINAGAEFVLISHATFVNVVKEKVPSSLSYEIITSLLKEDLKFKNIVITDSFCMGAVTQYYSSADAAVKAVEAGVDMVLMPENLKSAANGLEEAVKSGKISEERIDESVKKILGVKYDKQMLK